MQTEPLLAYRASVLKEHFTKCTVTHSTLAKHEQNLEWNIARLCRKRNEVVHDAAILSSQEDIVSHLRLYLVFIINSLIDFFIESPLDTNGDGTISIEDYFTYNEIRLDTIRFSKAHNPYCELLDVKNPIAYLS